MDKVRYGIIGLGFFGEKHLEVLSALPQVKVVGICTRRKYRLEELAKKFNVPKIFTDYNELLKDKEIDAVSIVTHIETHLEPTIAALKAGKHVFLEKPMARNVEECDAIIETARTARGFFMVGHICRFDSRYAITKRAIDEGKIGKIVSLYSRRNLSKTIGQEVLPKISPLMGDGVHDIDLMLWYTSSKVKTVYAYTLSARNLPNPDIGWAMCRFENGAIGVVECIWYLPENTPFDIDSRMEIIGTEGAVYIGGENQGVSINDKSGWKIPDTYYWPNIHGRRVGVLKDELEYFVDCILNNRKPDIISPEESREAVAVMSAAEESAKTGKIINLK